MSNVEWWATSDQPAQMLDVVATSMPEAVKQLRLIGLAAAEPCLKLASRDTLRHYRVIFQAYRQVQLAILENRSWETVEAVAENAWDTWSSSALGQSYGEEALQTLSLVGYVNDVRSLNRLLNSVTMTMRLKADTREMEAARCKELERQADVIRCVVPNPFLLNEWTPSSDVVKIAQGIRAKVIDKQKNRWMKNVSPLLQADLPILADAMEDAGCPHSHLLDHCRNGKHVLGCHVLESICAGH